MVDIGLSCSFRLEALVMEVVGGDVVGCTPASAQTTVELTAIDPSRPGEHHVIARRQLPRVILGEATLAPLRAAA